MMETKSSAYSTKLCTCSHLQNSFSNICTNTILSMTRSPKRPLPLMIPNTICMHLFSPCTLRSHSPLLTLGAIYIPALNSVNSNKSWNSDLMPWKISFPHVCSDYVLQGRLHAILSADTKILEKFLPLVSTDDYGTTQIIIWILCHEYNIHFFFHANYRY
jgi:hypothetical protein